MNVKITKDFDMLTEDNDCAFVVRIVDRISPELAWKWDGFFHTLARTVNDLDEIDTKKLVEDLCDVLERGEE